MNCPICGHETSNFFFVKSQEKDAGDRALKLYRCRKCTAVFASDYFKKRSDIYENNYATWSRDFHKHSINIASAKKTAFRFLLKRLPKYFDPHGKKILDVGTGGGYLLDEAKKMGFDCFGIDPSPASCASARKRFGERIFCGELEHANYPDSFFDTVSLTDVLEHLSNPQKMFREIYRILKPQGLLFVISPDFDSLSRKIFGANWFQYKYEHVIYFNRKSFVHLADQNGFQVETFGSNVKKYPIDYYWCYFKKYKMGFFSRILPPVISCFPGQILKIALPNPVTGEFLAIARKKKSHETR